MGVANINLPRIKAQSNQVLILSTNLLNQIIPSGLRHTISGRQRRKFLNALDTRQQRRDISELGHTGFL